MSLSSKLSGSLIRPFCLYNRPAHHHHQYQLNQSCSLLHCSIAGEHTSASTNRQSRCSNIQNTNDELMSLYGSKVNSKTSASSSAGHSSFSASSLTKNNNLSTFSESSLSLSSSSTIKNSAFQFCSSQQQSGENKDEIPEGLAKVHATLAENLPYFFQRPHDFSIYHPDVIFEDNIRNVQTKGLKAYIWQLATVKMGAHFKYGKVNLSILKITANPQDNTVRVRWRVVCVPGNNLFIFTFYKFKLWNARESIEKHSDEWIDGFSIFHVDNNGKVFKHIADKVIPDNNVVEKNKNKNPNLAASC